MSGMWLSEVAAALDAQHVGADVLFSNVSTDTRSLGRGDLFVALCGERFDGHRFIDQARKHGACAAMVSRQPDTELPLLVVEDTRLGLGRLAAVWRGRFDVALVAVTGSNGKTTTKEMIGAILKQSGKVLTTRGNLNNEIGVPLTLLRLREEHRYAVLEMGASGAGEIEFLTRLACPDVAVITNAAPAHLEGFGSLEGVARAKGEIFAGLAADGVAVINADDPTNPIWHELAQARPTVTFGLREAADLRADWWPRGDGSHVLMRTPQGDTEVELPLPGRHNVMNALAAAAAALVLGVGLEDVGRGLESLAPVGGRLQVRAGPCGMRILDDTYNANPASLAAALEVLVAARGERWLVLGDMAELGGDSGRLHEQAGLLARSAGIGRLYALGHASRAAVRAFGDGARHFDGWRPLVEALRADWSGEGTVLVKGSRSMHLERVVEALLANDGPVAADNGER